MGDEDDGAPVVGGAAQERQHGGARLGVEVARRLVGQDQLGLVHERAGHRQALLLAAAELVGHPRRRRRSSPRRSMSARPRAGRVRRAARQARGEQDVLLARQLGHEVVGLEDEADVVAAHAGQLALGAPVQAAADDLDGAGLGPVERAEQVQQRRLARARAPDDGHELAGARLDGGAVEHAPRGAAAAVRLHEAPRPRRSGTSHGNTVRRRRAVRGRR